MNDRRRPCDLIMKGGVTSGIVYPSAIREISRAFDLKSIGGTSAGAIAAALAAAAQYRRIRRAGTEDAEAGFERIARLPEQLGSDGNLLGLFAPNRSTRRLFACARALASRERSALARALQVPLAYALPAALGAIPGALGLLAASQLGARGATLAHGLVSLAVALAGSVVCAYVAFAFEAVRVLPRNGFGLISGIDDSRDNPGALATWLTRELEATAGLPPGIAPLTFAMLWDPQAGPNVKGSEDPAEERAIDLQMIATSLTEGRPYNLPCRLDRYYFKSDEMARYFPAHVVDWMEKKARAGAKPFPHFHALPPIGDLPVVVATRLSLAFPLLLSAVPLYAVDYGGDPASSPQPVWFSDGGLTSNFPIELFDSPLPRRPTLAINLGPALAEDAGGIRYARSNQSGRLLPFVSIGTVFGFVGAIFDVMQNWQDATLAELPGFRDRIVTVELTPGESGVFPIRFDAKVVEDLEKRGARAGRFLVERFSAPSTLAPDSGMSWENHRWLRYRTTMATLRAYLARFDEGYNGPVLPDVPYDALIESADPKARPNQTYPLPDDSEIRKRVAGLTLALDQLAQALEREGSFEEHAPRPLPELAVRARLNV